MDVIKKKCIIIVNELSGNSRNIDAESLKKVFGNGFDVYTFTIKQQTVLTDFSEYDRIVLCGGDGTLNGILNCQTMCGAEIIYCPSGTLNELATGNSKEEQYILRDAGQADDKLFSYVFACGIFTPLGYIVKSSSKKKFKIFAYISKVVSQYKLYDIDAKLTADGDENDGKYALIMAIDSPKCFGLKFNKMYKFDDGLLHLLTIKTPKHRGLLGKIELFFPLFRAFFIGFKKPYRSKKMFFDKFEHLNVVLRQETDFCSDGEKVTMNGIFDVAPIRLKNPIHVISQRQVAKMAKSGREYDYRYSN
ncbi:MAG: hypothetical protein NC037_00340 [Bacteroides sp.]|nr:hypothetical protein [Bacillota bacterium]MCM1393620.1 hypothetical protein [[Eubacterium] siraeum]MCM1454966.1 hypothetical protein [Bacteroides sp.]